MDRTRFLEACVTEAPSPCYVLWEDALRRNLEVLRSVKRCAGCRILLALKAFAAFRVFPLIREALDGTCASSPDEARLGQEEFGGEVHVYAPAYSDSDFAEILQWADCVVFNSGSQWQRFGHRTAGAPRPVKCGLRINPECSAAPVQRYDPCASRSRFGIRREDLEGLDLEGVTGFHFHTLCEQNADALERTLHAVEAKFGKWLPRVSWMNFGGGHHITREDYDVDRLCRLVRSFQERYRLDTVYLEPGEAVVLDAGVLVSTVLDVVYNEMPVVILDTSAACHMPDVLEMPYRPRVVGAGAPGERTWTCRLAGVSCLAGDIIGDYSFDRPLLPGDRVIFEDMAHYTMVKNTTFNGVRLPAIAMFGRYGLQVLRRFGYEEYRSRLG